jgi:hypothetical protein
MKNFWPAFDEFKHIDTPKTILEEQGGLIEKITTDMVYGEVMEINPTDKEYARTFDNSDFKFAFNIRGKFLENYKFTMLVVSHNIVIYPFSVRLDDTIHSELSHEFYSNGMLKSPNSTIVNIESENQFEFMLKSVFNCNHIKNVINSIISLSK